MKAVQIIARGQPAFVDAPKPTVQPGTAHRQGAASVPLRQRCSPHTLLARRPLSRLPAGETGHEMVGVVEAIDPSQNGAVKPRRPACFAWRLTIGAMCGILPWRQSTACCRWIRRRRWSIRCRRSNSAPCSTPLRRPARCARQDGRRHRPGIGRFVVQLRLAAARRRQDHRARSQSLPPAPQPGLRRDTYHPQRQWLSGLRRCVSINGGELPDVVVEAAGEDGVDQPGCGDRAASTGFVLLLRRAAPGARWTSFPYSKPFGRR